MVPVDGLGHHGIAEPFRHGRGLVLAAHDLASRNGEARRLEQLGRDLLVAGDVDRERRGQRRHCGPDPQLIHALAELDQRLVVEPDPGNVTARCLVQDGLGRWAERPALGQLDEPLHLGQEVESLLGLHKVVDQADGELAGGHADLLFLVAVDDVVPAVVAGATSLPPVDLRAGLSLELQRRVLGYVPGPGPLRKPLHERRPPAKQLGELVDAQLPR